MSRLFPDSNEFLMHPNAKKIAALPPSDLPALFQAQLDEQVLRETADLEEVMGLGQLFRLMKVPDVERHVEGWLGQHSTPKGYDVTSLFLLGFWPSRSEVSATLVGALLDGISAHIESIAVVDSLVSALGVPFGNVEDRGVRERIRLGFLPLLVLSPLLQRASQLALARVAVTAESSPRD